MEMENYHANIIQENGGIVKGGIVVEIQSKPSYYAVIPADVRYCDRLPPNAKLMYGEISALCSLTGYCFASNAHFAKAYGFNERTVRSLIGSLKKEGFVQVDLEKDASTGQVIRRKIWLKVSSADERPVEEIFPTPGKNLPQGGAEIFQDTLLETNTSITDKEKINKKEKSKKDFSKSADAQAEDFDPIAQMVEWIRSRFGESDDRAGMNALYLAMVRFAENRVALKKPMKSKGAVTGLCNRLSRMCGDDMKRMTELLDDATLNGWQSVYDRGAEQQRGTGSAGAQRREREWIE